MKTTTAPPAGLEHKSAAGAGLLDVDQDEGVVTAIVSVTGVKDRVNDVILPGAYTGRPIGVWHHDEKVWASRTEEIKELQPGDALLPTKTADGRDWPKSAGGLWVKTRYNMETQAGREGFSNVKFFGDQTGWSIGYRVPKDGFTMKDGIRFIKSLEVWEYSPVMLGAASEAMTLSAKSAAGGDTVESMDVDLTAADGAQPVPAEDLPVAASAGVDPVDEQAEATGDLGAPDPVAELHAAAANEIDWDEVEAADVADVGTKTDEPTEAKAEGGADRNRGNAEQLRRWYVSGEGAQEIRWGTDGDFMRCVGIASKHMDPARARGYCNLRHQDATGAPPGHAPGEGKALPSSWDPGMEIGPHAAHLPPPGEVSTVESKAYPYMDGTLEAGLEAVRTAVNEALRGEIVGQDDMGRVRYAWDYVNVDGTWPDRLVATRHCWDETPDKRSRETFEISYHVDGTGQVVLGTPVPVHLRTVIAAGSGEPDDVVPAVPMMDAAAGTMKALLASGETKSGRVLSGNNATRLRTAFEHLADVLRAAGVQLAGDPAGDEQPGAGEAKTAAADTSSSEDPLQGLPDPADYARSLRLLI